MTLQAFLTQYPHLNIPQPNTPPEWLVVDVSNVTNVPGYQNTITFVFKYANGTSQSGYAPSIANGWADPNNPSRSLYFTFSLLTSSFITPNPRNY
jgi:hypothetical protein